QASELARRGVPGFDSVALRRGLARDGHEQCKSRKNPGYFRLHARNLAQRNGDRIRRLPGPLPAPILPPARTRSIVRSIIMAAAHPNSFKARKTLKVGSRSYTYFSLQAVEKQVGDLSRLPFSLRVLLENLV